MVSFRLMIIENKIFLMKNYGIFESSTHKENGMITKNFIGLCLLTALSVASCKKNEDKHAEHKKDSSAVSPAIKQVPEAVKGRKPAETDSAEVDTKDIGKANVPASKKVVEGTFVAENCDGGRFSIEIKNSGGQSTFKIFDRKKIIAAGNVSSETDEKTGEITNLEMGEIGGLYDGDKIVIQNYGNSMNEFDHFTQCGDKYLEFTREQ